MDKGKILNVLNVLVFCSCGDEMDIFQPFRKYNRGSYVPKYDSIERQLGIKDCLSEGGLTLVDVARFIIGEGYDKALRYLSAVLEEGDTDLLCIAVNVYEVTLSNASAKIRSYLASRFEDASSLDDMLRLCKLLTSPALNSKAFSPTLISSMELSNGVLLKLARHKTRVSSWYCNVDVKNNYSMLSKLSREENILGGLLND